MGLKVLFGLGFRVAVLGLWCWGLFGVSRTWITPGMVPAGVLKFGFGFKALGGFCEFQTRLNRGFLLSLSLLQAPVLWGTAVAKACYTILQYLFNLSFAQLPFVLQVQHIFRTETC